MALKFIFYYRYERSNEISGIRILHGEISSKAIQDEPNSEKVCQSLAWHLPKKEHTHLYRM